MPALRDLGDEQDETPAAWVALDANAVVRRAALDRAEHMQAAFRPASRCPRGHTDIAMLQHHETDYDYGDPVLRPEIEAWLDETCPGQYDLIEHKDGVSDAGEVDALALRLPDGAALAFRLRWR